MSERNDNLYAYRSPLLTPEQWDVFDTAKKLSPLPRLDPNCLDPFTKNPVVLARTWCDDYAQRLTAAGLASEVVESGRIEARFNYGWQSVARGVLILGRLVVHFTWPGVSVTEARYAEQEVGVTL